MKQKRIALINDMTGFGRCSITIELPIISALKIQVCPLPTSILSVHTGFNNYFFDDYTDRMQKYIDSWHINNLQFDAIATGFLGSESQIAIVNKFIEEHQSSQIMIDPVMGDHGRLYASYNKAMCLKMRELLNFADLVTPNLTEACELLGIAYPNNGIISDSKLATMAANIANQTRSRKVIITGVTLDTDSADSITNFIYDDGKVDLVTVNKIGSDRSGTGDAFFAVLAGAILNGNNLIEATKKSTNFVTKCIAYAELLNLPWNYGLPFEQFLTEINEV